MSSPNSIEGLKQNRAAIVVQMRAALDANNMARYKELDAEQEEIRAHIDHLQKRSTNQLPGIGGPFNQGSLAEVNRAGVSRNITEIEERLSSQHYNDLFWKYFGSRHAVAMPEELRALGEYDGGDGSTLVPIGMQREIAIFKKAWGDWFDKCRTVTTATGNELIWPVEIDTTTGTATGTFEEGQYYAENAGPVPEVEPTFSSVTLYSDLMDSGLSKVPVSLFQDAAFSMEALLSQTFGRRLGRAEDTWFMQGNAGSSGRITGLLPSLTASDSDSTSVLAVGANANSGNSADTALNTVGSIDFAALIAAVDPAYRNSPNACFVANQATWDLLRSILDKYGRPIWSTSLAADTPNAILGYPIRFSQSLPTIAAGAVGTVIFGDFSQCVIRRTLGMSMIRYNELFQPYHQIGFQAYERVFQATLIPPAFSYLTHPLS